MRSQAAILFVAWIAVGPCAGFAEEEVAALSSTGDDKMAPMDAPRLRIGPVVRPDPTPPPEPMAPPASISLMPPAAAPMPPRLETVLPVAPNLRDLVKGPAPGYIIRTGDLIHFHVLDEDDMDLSLRVSKDGTVHIPYINSAVVGGRTINQAVEDITRSLKAYYISPIVSIELTEFAPNNVTILGQVNNPGVFTLPPQVESIGLMDAIGRAGGTNAIADLGNVTIKRVVNSAEQVIHVDGRPIARGVPGAHFEVLANDSIIVALTNNQFKVMGDIKNPGIYTLPPLTDSLDLGDAMAMAGGNNADLGQVTIKRVVDGHETVISLDKPTLRGYSRNEKSGDHFYILPGDTVELKAAKVDFIILGQVRNPGLYQIAPMQDSISILEALAMAGGATRLGDLGHVLVRRKVNNVDQSFKVDVKSIQDSNTLQIFQVFPGDTISVGERFL